MKWIFNILILLFVSNFAWAQIDSADLAITKCQSGEVKQAKEIIDFVQLSPTYNKEARTWIYKAYINKELAKQTPEKAWDLRKEAISSLDKAKALDVNNENADDIKKQMKHLVSLYNNEAVKNLQSANFEAANEYFKVFLDNMGKVDSSFNRFSKEIEFLLASATAITQEYNKDWKKNSNLIEKAEAAYVKVLALDTVNVTANYNLGMLYYNHAVHIINDMDYDLDLIALNDIEDKTINLFKKALPYELRANRLVPNRRETLMALQGIYFSLNDFEKSNYYKEQLDKLGK